MHMVHAMDVPHLPMLPLLYRPSQHVCVHDRRLEPTKGIECQYSWNHCSISILTTLSIMFHQYMLQCLPHIVHRSDGMSTDGVETIFLVEFKMSEDSLGNDDGPCHADTAIVEFF